LSEDITRLKILLETELTTLLNQRTRTKIEKNLIKVSRRQKNFPLTPKIEIVPDEKQEFHILSVTSSDVPGLLYNIVKTLGKHEVSVHTAKVSTLGEKVEDVFLIYGKGLQSEQGTIEIETDLRNSITV
jgi:[protein-PII] uridylyltransferase